MTICFFAAFLIAVVPPLCQLVVLALQVAGGHVVEKKLGLGLAPTKGKKALFNRLLIFGKPGEILVEVVFAKALLKADDIGCGRCFGQAYGR